jgi:pimeloyl-ACP methyl ester carboxylesterase
MRILVRILRWVGMCVLLLALAGAVYQQLGLALDSRFYPSKWTMFQVDGRTVHVVCSGRGPHSFVLDAGAGEWSNEWYRVQPLLSGRGRVCSFDRAGLGWSDPSSGSHDGTTAAEQLHAIVVAAKIPTPFIYVGHSLGANFAQIYYARYAEHVAGMVLLEPGAPKDLLEDFRGERKDAMLATDCGIACRAAGLATFFGVTRLATMAIRGGKNLSGEPLQEYRAGLARPDAARTLLATLDAVPKTAYEDLDVKSFGHVPVLLFTLTEPRKPEGKETVEDVKVWRVGYRAYLSSLAAKSSAARGPVDIPNSSHTSMVMGEPQAIFLANAISEFAAGIKP